MTNDDIAPAAPSTNGFWRCSAASITVNNSVGKRRGLAAVSKRVKRRRAADKEPPDLVAKRQALLFFLPGVAKQRQFAFPSRNPAFWGFPNGNDREE
jgi:hypothetical protein